MTLPSTPHFEQFFEKLDRTPRDTNFLLVETNRAVAEAVDYVIRMEPGVQTPEETLTLGRGSCRDSAWLLVQVLRRLGIAALRLGYLIQLTPDQKPIEGPPGPERTSPTSTPGAGCFFIPGAGWIGLDPTSGLLAAEGHIPLRRDAEPLVRCTRLGRRREGRDRVRLRDERDAGRRSGPRHEAYADEDWERILALGDRVDEDLRQGDVRLSVGGEPTFVSTEEPDAPEWNTAALGGGGDRRSPLPSTEAALGAGLAALQHGQGKWYPGEQLRAGPTRASTGSTACRSGADALFAESGSDYGHDASDAERFATHLARTLGLERFHLMDAYEDAWYYLWRERRLPTNVDPSTRGSTIRSSAHA
ncbi:MAG: transglutaminase family protein [Myxococcota bacterium]